MTAPPEVLRKTQQGLSPLTPPADTKIVRPRSPPVRTAETRSVRISVLSFHALREPLMKLFSRSLLDELTTRATASPRARAHQNIHEAASDPVQRFFVVTNRNSYF